MSQFAPKLLLSRISRDRCVSKLKQLPMFVLGDEAAPDTAAVLVPLCVVDDELCLLYTLRSSHLKNHSGQVSFPGGKTDQGENPRETALRETEEEIGLNRNNIDVWCEMSNVQGKGNIVITPVVGEIDIFDRTKLELNEFEVQEVFTVPIRELCNPANHAHVKFSNYPLPVYIYEHYKIWGITAFITHMFLLSFLPGSLYPNGFSNRQFKSEDLMPSKL